MKNLSQRYARRRWEDWYEVAKKYYMANGNLLIEHHYTTEEGYKLGRWIERQRGIYNGKVSGNLNETRIRMLEKIKMVWKLENRYSWKEWISKASEYYAKYGNLAVPVDYVIDGYALGNWICECRKKYSNNLLDKRQIHDLENYGMVWSFKKRRSFDDWYMDALDYFNTYGNLNVPTKYVAPNGFRLGEWISMQRAKYQHKKNRKPLTKKQIECLNALDMVWDINDLRDKKWHEVYKDVVKYKEFYGVLPLWPKNIKAQNGINMPQWIAYQRSMLADNQLSPDKIECLNKIGIYAWETKKQNRRNVMDIFEKITEILGLEYMSDMKFEPNRSRAILLISEMDLSQYSMASLSDLFQYIFGEDKKFNSSEEFKEAVALAK